jgi:predicted phage terminase large subunit-like protein
MRDSDMLSADDYNYILKNDLMSFIERSFYELNPQTPFLTAPYIELMASKLEACRRRKSKRLIINLPPRQLKSHSASIAFVAWLLGHDPTKHVICASYGQDLADKLARDCRNVMNATWYGELFQTRLSERKAVNDFTTTAQGTRMATSVGGVLTGRGADIIIIDDPLKPDEALSETKRRAVNDWYDNTLLSRLNDKAQGIIIMIMQRLHQDDLVGHVLGQEHWDIIRFPAIAEEDERYLIESVLGNFEFRRAEGEALHPEREPLATLARMRESMGEYNFASQYQQSPIAKGGAIVKTSWIQYYDEANLPEFYSLYQSWDTANKASELSDYSVCTTWGYHDNKFYLLDVFRKRLNYPELRRAVIDQAKCFGVFNILIEDRASGTQLIQDLETQGLMGVIAYGPPAGTDKLMRLHAQTALFENGNVLLPRQKPWLHDYINEITGFPGTKFDDQVDSTTQALDHIKNNDVLEVWRRLAAVTLRW